MVSTLIYGLVAPLGYAGLGELTSWRIDRRTNVWSAEIDVDGEVGHPLRVYGPTADCSDGSWSAHLAVTSGQLPPGLEMSNTGEISGIPTARGHWIVTMRASEVSCGGESYPGFTQQLRFHITGSGKVIE